jgi:GGDEF domain-containing protein
MSSTPDSPNPEAVKQFEQTALACYLSTVVAIGNCMAEVCPSVGAMYRDRLLKLPRRLGFDATPQALRQSQESVETDLLEYSRTASAWITAGSNHAAMMLEHLRTTEDTLVESADLQRAFLEDLAEHIGTSAEVDEEAQLRVAFKRYAAGLRAYSRRALTEKLATIDDLRRRREEIDAWLAEATASNFTDPETGLLNRTAAERRILTQIRKKRPFCVILVGSTEEGSIHPRLKDAGAGQIMKDLGERLAATIRPYDVIFRWSQDELMTIFEASESDIASRAQQIGGWLGDGKCAVEIAGETSILRTHTSVTVLEHLPEESAAQLITRIESVSLCAAPR